jgi:osmotically-inducible protein OsmY
MAHAPECSPRSWRGWCAPIGRVVLVGGISAGALTVAGAEPPAATAPNDDTLTLRAKKALWDNPALVKLNLGVRVRNGTATLHGPVPFAVLAEQAVSCVRSVSGIREVISELYVVPADNPLAQAIKEPVTARRTDETNDGPRARGSPAPDVRLPFEPSPLPNPAMQPVVQPVPTPAKPVPLIEQIAQMRDRDLRFAGIRIEVRGGQVTLRGTVARSQDAWEFARGVRALPGVTGVTQSVATAP